MCCICDLPLCMSGYEEGLVVEAYWPNRIVQLGLMADALVGELDNVSNFWKKTI